MRAFRKPATLLGLVLLIMFVIAACSSAIDANNKGDIYYNLGQYERAIQEYDEAIRIYPEYGHAYHSRGHAYEAMGKPAEAAKDFAKAKELNYVE
jgi:tetratricopeptide (TPR) repeat protein